MSGDSDLSDFSMTELFRGEVEAQLVALRNGLDGFQEDPKNPGSLETLTRAAHSIKGAARIVSLDAIADFAHAMEDTLSAVSEKPGSMDSSALDGLLRQSIQLFERLAANKEGELQGWIDAQAGEMVQLASSYRGLKEGKQIAPPAAAPVSPVEPPVVAPPLPNIDDASLFELFRGELEVHGATLNEGLLALENTRDPAEALRNLMRAAHSIKGAARIVGLDIPVKVAHAMEDTFVAAQEGKLSIQPDDVDLLLQGVDFFQKLSRISEAELGAWLGAQESLINSLAQQLHRKLAGEPVPPTPPAPAAQLPVLAPPTVPAAPPLAVAPQSPAVPAEMPESARPKQQADADLLDRAVKVTAANLNRILGLAAESLVETRQTRQFADDLQRLKKQHRRLSSAILALREKLERTERDSSLREACSELQQSLVECRRELDFHLEQFDGLARRLGQLSDGLYREVISSRMRPFEDGAQGFPRLVRDLARRLSKKVRFQITGKETAVDRDILEKLEAPLNHILRNALDHGMEFPNDRIAAGKEPEGNLRLEARHRAGMLLVEVSDDGPGINLDRVRRKVLEKNLSTPELIAKMTEAEILEFLFLPGFSTASEVTEVSGRGVGLDVVQAMVHEAGGAVRVFSQVGKGTTFQLQLPITRSVIRALLVQIAGEPYAFPLARIDRALKLPWNRIKTIENRLYFPLDNENVGLLAAADVLELRAPRPSSDEVCLVVVSDRTARYGLEVDAFLGERDLVVRPLEPRLGKVPDISSASLMEDGAPLLIIDVDDIVRSIDSLLSAGALKRTARAASAAANTKTKRVLVVDDSVTVREVERKLLENHGYEVDVAVDGREGWNAVRLGNYDLVISDVDMPRMNGIEFVRHIKQDARLKSLPVMIVSYKDREEDRMRGLEAGADYYFTKSSFHDATMINAVRDLIGSPEK